MTRLPFPRPCCGTIGVGACRGDRPCACSCHSPVTNPLRRAVATNTVSPMIVGGIAR